MCIIHFASENYSFCNALFDVHLYQLLWLSVPITDAVKMNILAVDISAVLIIGTPLIHMWLHTVIQYYLAIEYILLVGREIKSCSWMCFCCLFN